MKAIIASKCRERDKLLMKAELNEDYIHLAQKITHSISVIENLVPALSDPVRVYIEAAIHDANESAEFTTLAAAGKQVEDRMESHWNEIDLDACPNTKEVTDLLRSTDIRPLSKMENAIMGEVGHNAIGYLVRRCFETETGEVPLAETGRNLFGGNKKKNAGRIPLINHLRWMVYCGFVEVARGRLEPQPTGGPTYDPENDRTGNAIWISVTDKGNEWFLRTRTWSRHYIDPFQKQATKQRQKAATLDKEIMDLIQQIDGGLK